MKIGVAQTRPARGDIHANIAQHKELIALAVTQGVDSLFFPELSITGYEPSLADELAIDPDDELLEDFQMLSDAHHMTIAVGMPVNRVGGVAITMIIFQPHQKRQSYSKQLLHSDELPFFIAGEEQIFLDFNGNKIAPAICYESTQPAHSEFAAQQKANVYVACVAKTAQGVERSVQKFSDIAKKYSMFVLMANCVGHCDNFLSAGNSAIWNTDGELLGIMDNAHVGILFVDTATGNIVENTL